MDADTRAYLDQGFGAINKRLDEGIDRFDKLEEKLDGCVRDIGRHDGTIEAQQARIREVGLVAHAANNLAMAVNSAADQRERSDKETREQNRGQHTENLKRFAHVESGQKRAEDAQKRVEEAIKGLASGTTTPTSKTPGGITDDTPLTVRGIKLAIAILIAGATIMIWWGAYNAQHSPAPTPAPVTSGS